jgi:hypothetical protein
MHGSVGFDRVGAQRSAFSVQRSAFSVRRSAAVQGESAERELTYHYETENREFRIRKEGGLAVRGIVIFAIRSQIFPELVVLVVN